MQKILMVCLSRVERRKGLVAQLTGHKHLHTNTAKRFSSLVLMSIRCFIPIIISNGDSFLHLNSLYTSPK